MEWAELVHGIRVEPQPDAPRLVAADWLSDRGDLRGEYIAIACRWAASDPRVVDPDGELRRRSTAIDRSTVWQAPLRALGATHWRGTSPDLQYRRGFIERIALVGPAIANFAQVCQIEPIIELEVREAQGFGAQLAVMPELAQVLILSIEANDDRECELIVASQLLGGVQRFLSMTPISEAVGEALARGTLRPIQFEATIEVAGARAMARGDVLRELESFDYWNAPDALIEALAEGTLAKLRALTLVDPLITARGLDALGSRLGQLTSLTLRSSTRFGPEIAAALVRHVTEGNLRSLDLEGFDNAELVAVLRSPMMAGVEVLHINGELIGVRDALEMSEYSARW